MSLKMFMSLCAPLFCYGTTSITISHLFYRVFLYFRWFCHFDDDQYVNVPGLLRKLADFPADQPWYLGKNSIDRPLEILDRDKQEQVPPTPPPPPTGT